MSAQPSVGRIVLYTNLGDADGKYPPESQAAIITKVIDAAEGIVALHIFYPTGQFDMTNVSHISHGETAGTAAARGKWAWPAIIPRREINGTINADLPAPAGDAAVVAAIAPAGAGTRADAGDAIARLFDNRHVRGQMQTAEDLRVLQARCVNLMQKIAQEVVNA